MYELCKDLGNECCVKIANSVQTRICDLGNRHIQKSKEVFGANKSDHDLIRSLIDLHDKS